MGAGRIATADALGFAVGLEIAARRGYGALIAYNFAWYVSVQFSLANTD